MAKPKKLTSEPTVTISEEEEERCTFDVKIKVAGVDLKAVDSDGKVFCIAGREYSMSHFGSWALQGISLTQAKSLIGSGGIIAALTWGIQQICTEIDVWVRDKDAFCFTFQIRKSKQRDILERMTNGTMARNLENTLKERIGGRYSTIRVRSIILFAGAKKKDNNEGRNEFKEYMSRFTQMAESERVCCLMSEADFTSAYDALKKILHSDITDETRLQCLIRYGICCFHLEIHGELIESITRVIILLKDLDIPPDSVFIYHQELSVLIAQLSAMGMHINAIDASMALNKIIKKMTDPDQRLEALLCSILCCSFNMRMALMGNPMVCMKLEYEKHLNKIEKEIEYMRKISGCDRLNLARSVYYSVFCVEFVKAQLAGEPDPRNDRKSARQFICFGSAWADFTNIMSQTRLHPELQVFMLDRGFFETVKEISEQPSLLERRILDPRIARLNAILNRDYEHASIMSGVSGAGIGISWKKLFEKFMEEKSTELKLKGKEAAKEKQKGDEACRDNDFEKALIHYNKAISLDPSDAMLYSNKAAILISQGRLDLARSCCLTALNRVQQNKAYDDKDVAKVLAKLARVEFMSENFDQAMLLLRKCIRLHDDPQIRQQMKECENAIIECRYSFLF